MAINISVEAFRSKDVGTTIMPAINEISRIAKEVTELNNTLKDLIQHAMNELQNHLMVVVQKFEELATISKENAGSAEEVAASIEEQSSILEEINQNAGEFQKLLENLSKKAEKYSSIEVL